MRFSDSARLTLASLRRLNYRLNQACTEDLENLCSHICNVTSHRPPCGGLALRCLQDKQEEVRHTSGAICILPPNVLQQCVRHKTRGGASGSPH